MKMKKADLKIERIGSGGVTSKMLFLIPVRLDESWAWYDDKKAYGKAVTNQQDAIALRASVLAICDDK